MRDFPTTELEYARQAIRDKCIGNYLQFIRWAWPIIEPGRPFVSNWHIEAICDHLEACVNGEIRKLLINMPPRHMKSIAVAVLLTPWVWLKRPHAQFIYASYAQSLSIRDSLKARRVIEHADYAELFRQKWALTHDQNQKTKFVNTELGHRIATSVEGAATGEGGDFLLVDDPHSKNDSKSDTVRQSQVDWFFETMSTRGNDQKTVCKIVVMQRLHERDLSGAILERGNFEHLLLPAEFDGSRAKTTSIGFSDPRKKDGALLWPERFDRTEIDQLKTDLGPDESEGQLNQNPIPAGGGTFNKDWWQRYEPGSVARDNAKRVWQFWDCAQEPGVSNDYSVCATWGEFSEGYYLLDLWRAKVTQPILEIEAIAQAEKWQPDNIVIEKKSAGAGLIQALQLKTKLPIAAYNPKLPKITRALNATPTVAAGRCYIPNSAKYVCRGTITRLDEFLSEHERFPLSQNDDMVDTTSMLVEYWNKPQRNIGVRRL